MPGPKPPWSSSARAFSRRGSRRSWRRSSGRTRCGRARPPQQRPGAIRGSAELAFDTSLRSSSMAVPSIAANSRPFHSRPTPSSASGTAVSSSKSSSWPARRAAPWPRQCRAGRRPRARLPLQAGSPNAVASTLSEPVPGRGTRPARRSRPSSRRAPGRTYGPWAPPVARGRPRRRRAAPPAGPRGRVPPATPSRSRPGRDPGGDLRGLIVFPQRGQGGRRLMTMANLARNKLQVNGQGIDNRVRPRSFVSFHGTSDPATLPRSTCREIVTSPQKPDRDP